MTLKTLSSAAAALLMLIVMRASAGVPGVMNPDGLHPGEFSWSPELAPSGPVAVIVSLPEQRAYVYRNGIRIGISTVSTGKPGKDTPAGVYAILEKKREHFSNLYNDAPMPYMQRLTWGGIALHAGSLPGYPASHGCVRLPLAFAERLFATTGLGTVIVVADSQAFPASVVSPGLFSPIDSATGATRPADTPRARADWFPERSPDGPLTILLSTADREVVVLRNAVEIGRSTATVDPDLAAIGSHAFLLLEGTLETPSPVLPDRPALRWQVLASSTDAGISEQALRGAFESGRIAVPNWFAEAVHTVLRSGTTLILTDEHLQPRVDNGRIDVLTTDDAGDPD